MKHFKFEQSGKRRIHKKPTVHPSSVLRAPDEQARYLGIEQFVADLVKVRSVLTETRHGGEP